VSRMEKVEDAIGESNLVLSRSSPALRFRTCSYFRRWVARGQSLLITKGWK
jgi:hypothetical protein